METNKISTYLGFALRSGICSKGSEAVRLEIKNKKADVVLLSDSLSENGLKPIINACKNNNTVYTILSNDIFDRLLKSDVKVISIKKSELSKQITKIILAGENN